MDIEMFEKDLKFWADYKYVTMDSDNVAINGKSFSATQVNGNGEFIGKKCKFLNLHTVDYIKYCTTASKNPRLFVPEMSKASKETYKKIHEKVVKNYVVGEEREGLKSLMDLYNIAKDNLERQLKIGLKIQFDSQLHYEGARLKVN